MRTKKTGVERELYVMSQITKLVNELPPGDRERVVNWFAAQTWSTETLAPPAVQSASPALS